MFCKNCGSEMPDDGTFCPNCGNSTKETSENLNYGSNGTTKKGRVPKIAIIGGVVAVLIVGVVFAMQIGKHKETSSASNNSSGGEDLSTQIQKAKCVTDYSKDSTVDQMDTVTFGSYPQSDKTGNTQEPIEWIVLEKKNGKAFLLSKYILDCKCYYDKFENITWENCTLRKWLNDTFYNQAFNDTEKNKIQLTNVINSDNIRYKKNGELLCKISGGNNTNDNVFCLSIDEAKQYFYQEDMGSRNFKLATRGTKYAKQSGRSKQGFRIDIAESEEWFGGNSAFWLRSPGFEQLYAAKVECSGRLNDSVIQHYLGDGVDDHHIGVRVALWVNY